MYGAVHCLRVKQLRDRETGEMKHSTSLVINLSKKKKLYFSSMSFISSINVLQRRCQQDTRYLYSSIHPFQLPPGLQHGERYSYILVHSAGSQKKTEIHIYIYNPNHSFILNSNKQPRCWPGDISLSSAKSPYIDM